MKKINNNIIFNHLHFHTEYSFRDAITHVKDAVDMALELGCTALAVTDHGGMHATMELYKECLKRNKEFEKSGDKRRIKAILGTELYVLEHLGLLDDAERKHEKKHIVFLAKDIIGYHQIANAVTRGQLLKDKDTYPRITHQDIKEIFVGNHVVCLSACVNGEIASWIRQNNIEKAKEVALFYKSIFKDDYYLEIQDHNLTIEMEYLGTLIDLSKELNIPLVATNDCHYVKKEDYETREMVVAMRFGKTVDTIEKDCQELYMKSAKEMYDLFKEWPESISNTVAIADKCNVDGLLVEGVVQSKKIDDYSYEFNLTQIPYGLSFETTKERIEELLLQKDIYLKEKYYSNEELRNKIKLNILDKTSENNGYSKFICNISNIDCANLQNGLHLKNQIDIEKFKMELEKIVHIKHFPKFKIPIGFKDEKEYITYLSYEKMKEKYPINIFNEEYIKMVKERIDYELEVICDLHYEGYLLIVQDFINHGKTIGLIGPGRGSAVGSIVCYLIGITSVDPLPYNLIFERFLNKDRVSDPDIDTDFAPAIRDLVIEYVKEIYGSDAVCQIVTFGTLAAKAAIRNAGRVYNIPIPVCDKIAKMVPNTPGITLKDVLEGNKKKELEPVVELLEEIKKDKEIEFLIEKAKKIEGLIVQTGVHAAGVIIADTSVSEYCPLSYDSKKQIWITQAAKDSCEHDFGLLKMDFLGLENLNIINRSFEDIKRNHNITLTLESIDLTNEEEMSEVIYNIFVKGQTKGVFQFESDGMTNLLKRFKPKCLEDLILLNAAYRPGPIQYIDEIIEIKNGRKEATYICPEMKEILGVTFSKPIYQEQIQQIFHDVAGFSLGVADIIRRAMAKKKISELELYLPSFRKKLGERGVTEEQSQIFCDELMDFAKYAFNKSHATAYAVVAYQTAWLKHFYPVEYMANLLNSSTTKTMPIYINECKRMGIEILPPNVNISGMTFTPTTNNEILFGLKVKNTGVSGQDIIDERTNNGQFSDLIDFSSRMLKRKSRCMYANVIDSYALSGALDCFGKTRRTMNETMVSYVKAMNEKNEIETRKREREEELATLTNSIETISKKYEKICNKETLYNYAKDMKKANDKLESALYSLKENLITENEAKKEIENAEYDMQASFPTMFAMMVGLEFNAEELKRDLCEYAVSYSSYKRKENMEKIEDKIYSTQLNLEQAISINLPEYDRIEILDKEKELLGFYASGHPLDSMRSYIEENSSTWIGDLDEEHDGTSQKLVGRVSDFKMLYRKVDRKPMCKFVLEGLTGNVECICFTKAFEKSEGCIHEGATLIVYGRVKVDVIYDEYGEIEDKVFELQVENVQKATSKQRIYLRVDNLLQFDQIKSIIEMKCGGNNPLYVYFNDTKKMLLYSKGVSSYDEIRDKLPEMFELAYRE